MLLSTFVRSFGFADWNSLDGVKVKNLTSYIAPEAVTKELAAFEVIVAMRERTP